MLARLVDKVVIVAGAGGIGDEVARRCAAEGAAVVLGDIDSRAAHTVAEEIRAAGGEAVGTALDGTDEAAVAGAVALAMARFGRIDGLHANFARGGDGDDVLGIEMSEYDEIMRINARGYVLCTRHVLPVMLGQGSGSIVYTSSDAAYLGEAVRPSYAMSKAAVHALMRHVARRFGPQGVRANVIAPGVIRHGKLEAVVSPPVLDAFMAATMLKTRLGAPADIAAMATLLFSDEGGFITGQVMNVNGGTISRP